MKVGKKAAELIKEIPIPKIRTLEDLVKDAKLIIEIDGKAYVIADFTLRKK